MIDFLLFIYFISAIVTYIMFKHPLTIEQLKLKTNVNIIILIISFIPILNTYIAYISLKIIFKTAFK